MFEFRVDQFAKRRFVIVGELLWFERRRFFLDQLFRQRQLFAIDFMLFDSGDIRSPFELQPRIEAYRP